MGWQISNKTQNFEQKENFSEFCIEKRKLFVSLRRKLKVINQNRKEYERESCRFRENCAGKGARFVAVAASSCGAIRFRKRT